MNVGWRILPVGVAFALGAALVSGQSRLRLTEGQSLEAELKGGAVHAYEVELTAGTYLAVTFDQRGADVKPVILDPAGTVLYDYDGSEYGWEPAVAIAPTSGIYRVEARSARASAATGRYLLHVDAIRPPTAEDEARVHVAGVMHDGLKAYRTRTPDAIRHALDLFTQARGEWRSIGDRRGEAAALRAMASLANNLDDFPAQADYRREEIAIRRSLGDDYGEAEALYSLGIALNLLGSVDEARAVLTESRSIHMAAGRLAPAADALEQLCKIARVTGDVGLALELGYEDLDLARRAGDRRRESSAFYSIGQTHLALAEYELALDAFRRADTDAAAPGVKSQLPQAVAAVLLKQGRYDVAERTLKQSLAVWIQRQYRAEESNALRWLGELYALRSATGTAEPGDVERARDMFEQSAAKAAEASFVYGEATARRRLGEILLQLGQLDAADRALALAASLAGRDSEPGARAAIAADQAILALARGDLVSAHARADASVAMVESARGLAESARIRTATFASSQKAYEASVRVLMAEHEAHPSAGFDRQALEVSERARARSLLELVMDLHPEAGASSTALDDLRALQERIHAKAEAADQAQRAKRPDATALARELGELIDQVSVAETRVKRETPDAATAASPQPLSADVIQREVLDGHTVLVEYMLAEPASYVWVVSPTSLAVHRLEGRSTIETAAREYRERVATPPGIGINASHGKPGTRGSAALSRLLIEPLGGLPPGRRLLIVAPGSLQQVPFAALTEGPAGPLVARHEIVHAPSASIVAAVRSLDAGRTPAARTLAVFADPVFESSDPRVHNAAAAAAPGEQEPTPLDRAVRGVTSEAAPLARLPFTRREADAIVTFAPAASTLEATDFGANLRQVTSPSLADYRILHFATHGLLDTRTPELSGLVFSLVTEDGHPQDGFLRLTDISRLRLNADLAVLSGCETGRGRIVDGEGVIGLTRSFVIAGARRVVASLWQVDDLATAEFMKRFYREMLVRHRSPSAALAAAQRQMAASDRWSAPYFWAGFVIQGEWR